MDADLADAALCGYLPELAWKMKTGRDDYNHSPDVWCETFSNSEGWPGITPLKDRLLNL